MNRLRKFTYLMIFTPVFLNAQNLEEEAELPIQGSSVPAEGSGSQYAEEKIQMLKLLKEEIEPNLLPADAKRIRRNVMRLGSYNEQWSREAMDFLVANAPLAEIFLYDYSRLHNLRLNSKILETLSRFESFQYPRATLIFSSDLLRNSKGVAPYVRLLQHIVSKNPSVFEDYFRWLFTHEAKEVPFVQRANFLQKSCRAGAQFSVDLRSQVDQWTSQGQDLWAQIFLEETRACLKGL